MSRKQQPDISLELLVQSCLTATSVPLCQAVVPLWLFKKHTHTLPLLLSPTNKPTQTGVYTHSLHSCTDGPGCISNMRWTLAADREFGGGGSYVDVPAALGAAGVARTHMRIHDTQACN